ncbi:MAG: inositol monophosphatase family protein [Planctomycetota bacterium]|jgi:myo-inositol-1(or 4)-monophosphatase
MALKQKDLSGMLETAIVAARLAGQHAMEELAFIKATVKNDHELVTQADAKCQQIIINRIKETYPDHGFIAEEGREGKIFKQIPRGTEKLWWVIDPIDGTNNFAHGLLIFTVSIAVLSEGQPIVGVVFEPATDSMFSAVKGGDAQLNGRRINVNEDEINKFTSIGIDSHLGQKIPGWASEIITRTRFRCLGSTALHLAYTAKGSLAGTVLSRQKVWDIAAGVLIAESAGAIVSTWKNEKVFPIDLDSYEKQELKLIVSNKKIHAELLKLLNS